MKRNSSCNNGFFRWVVYTLFAIFLLLPSRLAAQAGTSPELYELTKKCMMLSGTANYDGIKLSNELYDKAVKLGDKYAQSYAIYCLANLYIYYIPDDTLQFVPKINDLMVKAKKLGAIPLADKIYWYETYFFCSNGYFNRALQVAKDWNNYIKNSDKVHEWGETRYYYMMGIIYYRLNNVEDAKKFFDRCFELCEKSKDDNVTEPDIWIRQLQMYIQPGMINKSKALQCAKKALAHPRTEELQKLTVYLYLANYYLVADDLGKEGAYA